MNKLQGFYALQKLNLPAIPWKKYDKSLSLDSNILWTIRSAVMEGDDLNLPRMVGVTADEAENFANMLYGQLSPKDLIVYYPFFIAKKSGVLDISNRRITIEAVKEDLWNLVTYNNKDVTIIFEDEDIDFIGDEKFLSHDELIQLIDISTQLKKQLKSELDTGKSVLLEWSFAYKSDINKSPVGDMSLIFYEIRTV